MKRKSERGSALIYILIAIALLAVLTITFMEPSSQQTSSQNTFKTLTGMENQVDVIRSAIQECVLSYPQGDSAIVTTGGGASDLGARKNYPINPDSNYYASATPGKAGNRDVKNIRCPGNNPGGVDQANHALVFSSESGKYMPQPPDLFGEWQYYNGTDGIFFWIATSKSDAFLLAALKKLDDKYSECEADVIDTSFPSAGNKDLDSDGTVNCPSGNACFRVWMIMNKATAVFPGDADNDEASCAP
jgi:hypothetical protein